MSDPRVDAAAQLLRSARQCVTALKRIIAEEGIGNAPRGILAGHAIEAALKSYLALRGWSDKRSRGLGHDLVAAWTAAVAEGLDILSAAPRWLRGLSFMHDNLRYRYPEHPPPGNSDFWLPRIDVFMETVEDLVETVGRAFPPSPPEPEIENWWE